MVIEISPEKVYIFIIVGLSIVQIIQWRKIHQLADIVQTLIDQIKVIALASGAKMAELEKKLDEERKRVK